MPMPMSRVIRCICSPRTTILQCECDIAVRCVSGDHTCSVSMSVCCHLLSEHGSCLCCTPVASQTLLGFLLTTISLVTPGSLPSPPQRLFCQSFARIKSTLNQTLALLPHSISVPLTCVYSPHAAEQCSSCWWLLGWSQSPLSCWRRRFFPQPRGRHKTVCNTHHGWAEQKARASLPGPPPQTIASRTSSALPL
jgi:hypothetical protein